jgi:hypothetical protein
MGDQEKLDKIRQLYDNAKSFGYQELEIVLPVVESLEDLADRDSYICICAEWLAQHGELKDLGRALALTRSTKLPVAKYSAFLEIASRFARENRRKDALNVLNEAEATVLELEGIADQTELQKASAWDKIADIYHDLGEKIMAKNAWIKASRLAHAGQYDARAQEVHDNSYLLLTLTRKLASTGYVDEAVKTAQSIKLESWRNNALEELGQDT